MAELVTRRENAIGWILFSNPTRHNAVTYEMIVALPEAVARYERDPQVRVIAFAGDEERAFVSGADVTEFAATRGSVATTYIRAMEEAYRAIVNARKATLACMRGAWFGGGMSLALYCDLRMCADDAEFSQPGVRLGSALSYPSTKRLVDMVGPGHAADLLFTGRRVAAAQALALGLVNRVVPATELSAAFAAMCAEIGENAPLSIAAAKIGIHAALLNPAQVEMRAVLAAIDAAHASEDALEGRKAYAEKRKPLFRGR